MRSKLDEFLSEEERQTIRTDIKDALTLPASAFFSTAFHELEVDRIFARNWVALCFEFQVPEPGDASPVSLCGWPLVVVRGADRKLRVFHNICPYDGCPVVIEPVKAAESLVVRYHGWRYDLNGKLLEIPYWDGTRRGDFRSLRGRECDLVEVGSRLFSHMVFVDALGKAGNFEDHVGAFNKHFCEYDHEGLQPLLGEDGKPLVWFNSLRANWKTYVENACINVLHENFTHRSYNASPDIPRIRADGVKSYVDVTDGRFMALQYHPDDYKSTYRTLPTPHVGIDRGRPPTRAFFATLYPNVIVSATPYWYKATCVLPEGPEKTVTANCAFVGEGAAGHPDFRQIVKGVRESYGIAFKEDGEVLEAIQWARRSPVWRRHFYSPFWDLQHYHFTNLVLDDLERPEP
jgi:phenylpropionate dioxygenase-like ring-hydroxylating dioxygenase large terminal subunit